MTDGRVNRPRRASARRRTAALGLVVLTGLLGACGDDDNDASDETTTSSTAVSTTSTTAATTTSVPAGLEQPAVWPAADVVFATPEEVAADFVREVLGVPPELGEFMAGDSRSGEMAVYSPGEGAGATPIARSLLLLRQLGPDSGWFVTAAINEQVSITSPESMTEVDAGPLTVEGMGRGFEGAVVVNAVVAGDATAELDRQLTQGGSTEASEPYTVELDLTDAPAGATVAVVVRGGVGLETDPGEFSALPIVISG